LNNVNVTFLDKTNLLGYDGQDYAKVRTSESAVAAAALA
jgi:hypothetical protein